MKIGHNKYEHMKAVAEYMYRKAEEYGLNPEEAYTVGLLHDIGYIICKEGHAEAGAGLLRSMGLKEKYTDAVACHGTNGYSIPMIKQSPIQYLLQEADMSIDKYGKTVGFDGRLRDIGSRYGFDSEAFKNASETVRYLKAYPFNVIYPKVIPVQEEEDWEYGTDGCDCR